ncbi:MAG: MBL fold metallo-hydrolase [Nanobdellota archaeon]
MVTLQTLTIGDLPTKCYLLTEGKSCLLIDPGSDYAADIKRIMSAIGDTELLAVICTHNHFDHIMGAHHFDVPCYLHDADIETLEQSKELSMRVLGLDIMLPEDIRPLSENMTLGSFSFRVLHTPGHSPGSCALLFHDDNFLLSGDTLFAGTCGRTDLPGSDETSMKKSLKRLLELPEDLNVYPGHGDSTRLGAEQDWIEDFISQ